MQLINVNMQNKLHTYITEVIKSYEIETNITSMKTQTRVPIPYCKSIRMELFNCKWALS